MIKRLLFVLAIVLGTVGVTWGQNNELEIVTELAVAETGVPLVYGVTTQGSYDGDVYMTITPTPAPDDLKDWTLEYYEPNGDKQGWKVLPATDGVYYFGVPSKGFDYKVATSYFKMTSPKAGTYSFTIKMFDVTKPNEVVVEKDCSFTVADKVTDKAHPLATIVDTTYASLATAVLFAPAKATISLAEGTYALSSFLAIKKDLTIEGAGTNKSILQPTPDFTSNPADGGAGHLITVSGAATNVRFAGFKVDGAPAKGKVAFKGGVNIYEATAVLENIVSQNTNAAGVIVASSKVTARQLTTSGNAWGGVNVDKSSLAPQTAPKFTFESGSLGEAQPIYSNDKTDASTGYVVAPVGWIRTIVGGDAVWKQEALLPVLTAPTAGTIEAGQSLSLSMLKGGVAKVAGATLADSITIPGLFAWKNPAEVATVNKSAYQVVFTPTDPIRYATAEIAVEIKDIKQYYVVTVGKSANGKVLITPANAANKYAAGAKLALTHEAEPNYSFSKWLDDAAPSYTVTKDDVLTAEFKPIMHTVTIDTSDSGSVQTNGGANTSITVPQGSSLSVVAVPAEGNVLKSLTCSDSKVVSNGAVVVDKPFTITADFEPKPADKFAVNTTIAGNGKLLLFDTSGNAIPAGSAVVGEISVLAVADQGYAAGTIGGAIITNGKCTITAATTLTVTFTKQTYAVTTSASEASIAIAGEGSSSLTAVPFGSELTATVTQTDTQKKTHRLLSLLVNGKEIPDGGTFTVTAATEVKAVMRKLATLTIDKSPQTYVYDGTEKAFVVKTTPAGVGGFAVTYADATTANNDKTTKRVTIKRDADDVYAAVDETIAGGLVVLAAEMKDVPLPTFTNDQLVASGTGGSYAWVGDQGTDSAIKEVKFTPTDANYKAVTFSVWNQKGNEPGTVTYNPTPTKSALRADAGSLSVSATGGSVVVLNGTTPVSGALYVGQTLTLKGVSAAGKSSKATWAGGGTTSADGTSATITLQAGKNAVQATFASKSAPTAPTITTATAPYTGAIFGGVTPVASAAGWNIAFKQGETVVLAPTNAGVYNVIASCPEDPFHTAVENKTIGTFTITPVASTVTVTGATGILAGQSLAQSIISGTSDVDGTFEWAEPNKVPTATADQTVVFVPKSANYTSPSAAKTANVAVATVAGVTLRTLNLTVTNPDKGEAVKMELNGTEATPGTIVTKGDKLKVTFKTTVAGYAVSATINGAAYTSGREYTVLDAGNVAVAVSYTLQSGGSEDDTPATGVTLSATTKTLAIGAEFTLTATVAPADATIKTVNWTSSNPAVATVSTSGKVKALKAGTASIIATTTDGGFTALCAVTVTAPTGLDDILASTRVYAEGGTICIVPDKPLKVAIVNMLGGAVFSGQVTDLYRVPVSSGVYLVKLGNGRKESLVKVLVR